MGRDHYLKKQDSLQTQEGGRGEMAARKITHHTYLRCFVLVSGSQSVNHFSEIISGGLQDSNYFQNNPKMSITFLGSY